jgi:predicted XRE-type DNA-binding protein
MKTGSRKKKSDRPRFEFGSGNVFADIGVANPKEALAKSRLAQEISALIADAGLTQMAAAKILGIDQPKVSNLMRGRLKDFSMSRLFEFLNKLGQDIQISVHPARKKQSAGVSVELCAAED